MYKNVQLYTLYSARIGPNLELFKYNMGIMEYRLKCEKQQLCAILST